MKNNELFGFLFLPHTTPQVCNENPALLKGQDDYMLVSSYLNL